MILKRGHFASNPTTGATSCERQPPHGKILYDLVDKHFSKYTTLVIFSNYLLKNRQTLFETLFNFYAKVDEHLIFQKNTLSLVQMPDIVGHPQISPLSRFM